MQPSERRFRPSRCWQIIEAIVVGDYALDLSRLLPEYAPILYSQYSDEELDQVTYNGKLIGMPNLVRGSDRICVVARADLLQKFDIKEIGDFEDYENFLRAVKENEKLITPAPVANINTAIFMQKYGYAMLDGYLVYRWDDPEMKLYAWEQTPENREAYKKIKKLMNDGCIDSTKVTSENILLNIRSGSIASFVSKWDDAIRIMRGAGSEHKLKIFPLDMDMKASRSSNRNTVIIINKNSKNPEKVIRFFEWIQSKQENYDLFMYGIEGQNYVLENNRSGS